MKLKTKAKILAILFCFSCVIGSTLPNAVCAVDPPEENASTSDDQVKYVSPDLLCRRLMGLDRARRVDGKDVSAEVNSLLEDLNNERIVIPLCFETPSCVHDALSAAGICSSFRDISSLPMDKFINDIFIEPIERYIRHNGINVDRENGRLLRDAVSYGKPFREFVTFLIEERDANPNLTEPGNLRAHTALSAAFLNDDYYMVDYLLKHGATYETMYAHPAVEQTPLDLSCLCVELSHRKIFGENVKGQIDKLKRDIRERRITMRIDDAPRYISYTLSAAISYYSLTNFLDGITVKKFFIEPIIQHIRENDIDVNFGRGELLRSAAFYGGPFEELVRFLIEERHADPNLADLDSIYSRTALYAAHIRNNRNMVNYLLAHGAKDEILEVLPKKRQRVMRMSQHS